MSGGGGSGKRHVANYFMSIHYGICTGPVDSINSIKISDLVWWSGKIVANSVFTLFNDIFGGSAKQGGAAGTVECMFGGEDQIISAQLASRLGRTPTNSPGFRGITSMFFRGMPLPGEPGYSSWWVKRLKNARGFYWLSNLPSLPAVIVNVTRYPVGPSNEKDTSGYGQANPAHIIFECLTNTDWGSGTSQALIDLDSFKDAAATLKAEGFYMSLMWARSDTIENFIGEVLGHIQGTLGSNPLTGKLRLKLLRNDYYGTNLFIVHPGNASMKNLQRKVWGETANEVVVTYTDPDSEEDVTVTAHDDANIAIQGAVVSTSHNYYGVRSPALARVLADRDLRQSATPLLAAEMLIDRAGWSLMVGDVVELRWPEYGIASAIMRVGDVNYGKAGDAEIKVSLLEDIFSFGLTVFEPVVEPSPGSVPPVYPPPPPTYTEPPFVATPVPPPVQPPQWVDPREAPRALDYSLLGTTPYYVLARVFGDNGLAGFTYPTVVASVLVSQNSADTASIEMWAQSTDAVGNVTTNLLRTVPNRLRGHSVAALIREAQSSLNLTNTVGGTAVAAGQMLVIHAEGDETVTELAAVQTIMDDGTLIIRRGVADTVPLAWAAGAVVWAYPLDGTTMDTTARADGQVVEYQFAPVTSAGAFDVQAAALDPDTLDERPYQPYRPANVTLNGDLFGSPTITGPVTVAWSRRNRVFETGQLLLWTDGDVAPEVGQTTSVMVMDVAGNIVAYYEGLTETSVTIPANKFTSTTGSTAFTIHVWSERDGFQSRSTVDRSLTTVPVVGGYGKLYGQNYGE